MQAAAQPSPLSAFNLYRPAARPAAHIPAKAAGTLVTPPPQSQQDWGPCLSPATLQSAQISLYSSATWSGSARTDWSRADTARYATGLAESAILKRVACKPETQAAKDRHLQELEQWLQPHSPRNLLTFLPADFEVYFTHHWGAHTWQERAASYTFHNCSHHVPPDWRAGYAGQRGTMAQQLR